MIPTTTRTPGKKTNKKKSSRSTSKDQENKNSSSNVATSTIHGFENNFQSINGLARRRTPRKKKKNAKQNARKNSKNSKVSSFSSSSTSAATTKVITMEDDEEGSYSSSSFRLENQHGLTAPPPLLAPVTIHNIRSKGNEHATTMSNEHVTVDIPHSFVLSDEDNDEDDDDDDDNDNEATGREGGRQKRRRAMRQSNALNEDRYDFCLVVDTSKTSEDGCENGTATAAVTTTSSTSTWCTCFSSKKKKTTTKAKEEDNDNNEETTEQDEYKRNEESRVSGVSGESDDDDDDGDDDDETGNDDPARKYNRRPMEKLRRLRRVARREIELQGEDDDDDDDDDDDEDKDGKKQRGRLFTTSSAMETLDVEHTGAGLQGQRMTSLIRAKLRHSGLQVKRVQNLTGTRTLLKVRAKQERLEEEAERMRLVMRTKDGGYARFKILDRQIFCGSGYSSISKNHVL